MNIQPSDALSADAARRIDLECKNNKIKRFREYPDYRFCYHFYSSADNRRPNGRFGMPHAVLAAACEDTKKITPIHLRIGVFCGA